jgi:hypothetical protein
VFVGDQVVYTARVGGRSLTGKSRQSPGSIGHEIDLVVAPDDVLVFPGTEPPIDSPEVQPQDRLIPIS